MLMYYALYIAIGTLVLGVLVINKDITLQVLNNISFKWVLDRKGNNDSSEKETEIQLKNLDKVKIDGHFSRFVGIRLTLLGAFFLIATGYGWFTADFQRVLEISSKVYLDDPNRGRDLISLQCVSLGIFVCYMTFNGINFSNKNYEKMIYEKVSKELMNNKKS